MQSAVRVVALLSAALVVLLTILISLAFHGEFSPPAQLEVETRCAADAPPLSSGQEFTVTSWNLQFGAGRAQHFFYDGGDAVQVPATEVSETIAGMVAAISSIDPDIALLQEVDRGSSRTQKIDQLPAYAAALDARCDASSPYHRSPFVPQPLSNPMGRVDMHLALLTRTQMQGAVRHALPLLKESRLRQVFNLKRALLVAELPIDGQELPLAVAVSHLSAFSKGDGTLIEQLGVLQRWMDERPAGQAWILGADLNAPPPDDDLERLGGHAVSYRGSRPAMQALLESHKTVFAEHLAPAARTWLPYGQAMADRKIDWLFFGGPIELLQARVGEEFHELSDHLPLIAEFRIQPGKGGGNSGKEMQDSD